MVSHLLPEVSMFKNPCALCGNTTCPNATWTNPTRQLVALTTELVIMTDGGSNDFWRPIRQTLALQTTLVYTGGLTVTVTTTREDLLVLGMRLRGTTTTTVTIHVPLTVFMADSEGITVPDKTDYDSLADALASMRDQRVNV
jgi:hypothetical protein